MPSFQTDVLDHIAKVVGGTVTTQDAHFFSGDKTGVGDGVVGLKGCYSSAPNGIQSVPVGIVLPGPFRADLASQGEEDNIDELRILILVARYDNKAQMAQLTPFRDLVPAAFRAHMQAYSMPGCIDAFITQGTPGVHEWGGISYLAYEFICRVRRMLAVTYSA